MLIFDKQFKSIQVVYNPDFGLYGMLYHVSCLMSTVSLKFTS